MHLQIQNLHFFLQVFFYSPSHLVRSYDPRNISKKISHTENSRTVNLHLKFFFIAIFTLGIRNPFYETELEFSLDVRVF